MMKFFRKRQKELLAVAMAGLLIIWLGGEAFTSMFNVSQAGDLVAHTAYGKIKLEASTPYELDILTKLDKPRGRFSVEQKRIAIDRIQSMVNYRNWRTRARVEMLPSTIKAHRLLYEGKVALTEGKVAVPIRSLESGLLLFVKMLEEYPVLKKEDETIEEIMIGILAWRRAQKLRSPAPLRQPVPQYPKDRQASELLRNLWDQHQDSLNIYRRRFAREFKTAE